VENSLVVCAPRRERSVGPSPPLAVSGPPPPVSSGPSPGRPGGRRGRPRPAAAGAPASGSSPPCNTRCVQGTRGSFGGAAGCRVVNAPSQHDVTHFHLRGESRRADRSLPAG